MKIEIEQYKGQTIYYNDDNDKFECDITVEDTSRLTKRQSLKDVRKEIDFFIKINVDFVPFKAIFKDKYGDSEFSVRNVLAIRTDGKFVVSDTEDDKYKSYLNKKDMNFCMVYNPDIIAEKNRILNELDLARLNYINAIKDLFKKLIQMDLSKYECILPTEEKQKNE